MQALRIHFPRRAFSQRDLALTLLLLLVIPIVRAPLAHGMPRIQRHELRHEIDQLEDAWRNAILKSDTAAMSSLLADDYIAITSSGTLQTKDEALANLRSGRIRITSLTVSDRKIRFYGHTALVTSMAAVEGTGASGNLAGYFRYTRVYIRNARGEWKIVSFEASRIRRHPGNIP